MKTNFAVTCTAFAATLFFAAAAPAMAQAPADAAKAAPKAVAKKTPIAAPGSSSRVQLKSQAKNVAAGIEAADAALTPAEMALAERVYVGKLPCELGAAVTLTPDLKFPGYFAVQGKNFNYRMFPVPTTTGTIRLEDRKAGAVWLQMGNKSMLMNQKLGTRLADECMSPEQMALAEAIKLNPPISVLDAPKPAASAPVSALPDAVILVRPAAPAAAASAASAAK